MKTKEDLEDLGQNYLNVPHHVIERSIHDHQSDLDGAAYSVLSFWGRQLSLNEAKDKLKLALENNKAKAIKTVKAKLWNPV